MDFTSFLLGVLGVTIFQYIGIQTNNIFKIIDDGREVLNQQYRIYQELYIYCASMPFNKKISSNDARKAIDSFIAKIEADPNILNYLSTPLVGWLEKYVSQGCKSQDITSIQYQIEIDFARIQYKLDISNPTMRRHIVIAECLFTACIAIAALSEREYIIMVCMVLFFIEIVMMNLSEIKVWAYNTRDKLLLFCTKYNSNRNRHNNKSY